MKTLLCITAILLAIVLGTCAVIDSRWSLHTAGGQAEVGFELDHWTGEVYVIYPNGTRRQVSFP